MCIAFCQSNEHDIVDMKAIDYACTTLKRIFRKKCPNNLVTQPNLAITSALDDGKESDFRWFAVYTIVNRTPARITNASAVMIVYRVCAEFSERGRENKFAKSTMNHSRAGNKKGRTHTHTYTHTHVRHTRPVTSYLRVPHPSSLLIPSSHLPEQPVPQDLP